MNLSKLLTNYKESAFEEFSSSEIQKIKLVAGSRAMTQIELAKKLNVSVSGMRDFMKAKNIKWRKKYRTVTRRPIRVRDIVDRKNPYYHGKNSTQVPAPFGGGYLNIRK